MPLFKKCNVVFIAFVLSGCGYHAVGSSPKEGMVSVAVPLIREDEDGVFRNALAEVISETGRYRYVSYNAPYELIVKIERTISDTIGYASEVDPFTGAISKLSSSEGKKTVVAWVTLRDSKTKEAVLEPFRVSAQANYDFMNSTSLKDIEFKGADGRKEKVLQYSLGQLDSEESAKAEVQAPLFRELAQKIGEVIVRAPPYEKKT